MTTPKKIGLVDCEPDLRMKLESLIRIYNGEIVGEVSDTALHDLIIDINKELDNLKANKLDATIIAQYFNKASDKLSKEMLDSELAEIANRVKSGGYRLQSDKITYSELAKDITDKVEGIETRLSNLNKYILQNGASSGGDADSGSIAILQGIINELSAAIQANKEEEDAKIAQNTEDIIKLQTNMSDVINTIGGLDELYKKVDSQVSMNELPNDVQTVTNNLINSISYSQDDKDLLYKLQELSGHNTIPYIYGYWAFDEASLDSYAEKLYGPIYYEIYCTSGTSYLINYSPITDGTENSGTLDNATSITDTTDRQEVLNKAPEYKTYNATVLPSTVQTDVSASLIYGKDNKALVLRGQLVAQRATDIINEEITLESDCAKYYDMSQYVESILPLDIKIYTKDSDGQWTDATHYVSLSRGDIPATNSKGEATTHIGFKIFNKTSESLDLLVYVRGNLI